MKRLIIATMLVACGPAEGPQGPPGPQGPSAALQAPQDASAPPQRTDAAPEPQDAGTDPVAADAGTDAGPDQCAETCRHYCGPAHGCACEACGTACKVDDAAKCAAWNDLMDKHVPEGHGYRTNSCDARLPAGLEGTPPACAMAYDQDPNGGPAVAYVCCP